MPFLLSPVSVSDAEILIRKCDFPAMQDNPLHMLMFPYSSRTTWESEMQWMIYNLKRTLEEKGINFRKVCTEDGTPVGFAGWTIEQSEHEKDIGVQSRRKKQHEGLNHDPETLDVDTWLNVSKMFRDEKKRVLHDRKNIWRLMLISVAPAYQRQGVGSMLMQWGCEEGDRNGQDAYILASPAAIRLYAKFGFEVAGEVRTNNSVFTSMFRKARETSN